MNDERFEVSKTAGVDTDRMLRAFRVSTEEIAQSFQRFGRTMVGTAIALTEFAWEWDREKRADTWGRWG